MDIMTKLSIGLVSALVLGATTAGAQSPETHWLSLINTTHAQPQDVRVVVVPPVYFSQQAFLGSNLIDTSNLVMSLPGVRAAMEAIDYWDWMVHDSPFAPANLEELQFPARVLGVDATFDDLAGANIVVLTGMVTDPLPFVFHFGLGLPTLPPNLISTGPGAASQDVCTVINTGVGGDPETKSRHGSAISSSTSSATVSVSATPARRSGPSTPATTAPSTRAIRPT